nr:hypothetical protein [Tanacetum cinerariifolium]
MDVKSPFLYVKIEEEVYVCQPPGFEDPDFPDRVYKVEKALYGLHQAPRAWYETLSTYLLDNEFQRGKIDKTLFIKRHKGDILLVQVYVDDIIFVKQKKDGIFISQDKYVTEILKKFRFTEVKNASTPMETQKPLPKDEDGKEVDVHMYRSMIGSLMYLISSRPNIIFTVCAYARYQVNPKVSHLHAVKRIFRYLKSQLKLGFWYLKDSPLDLVAYTDSDYAGASLDMKSTIGGCQFLGCRLISWMCKKQTVVVNSIIEVEYVAASTKTINGEAQLHDRVDGKKIIITEASIRRDLQLANEEGSVMPTDPHHTPTILQSSSSQPQKTHKPRNPTRKVTQVPHPSDPIEHVTDEAVHKELGDSLVRAATTASSLEAEQDSGGGPRCQEAMGDTTAQTRFKSVSKYSNDSLLVIEQEVVSIAATTVTTEEITLAQALKALKTSKPKVKGIVIQEQEEPDKEEVAIDAISLAVKSPRIVDWKIHKERKKSYYQIVRADEKTQMYMVFSKMLESFDREDLEDLYKLVKARYGSTRPVEDLDLLLWNDLKTMFEPHVEDKNSDNNDKNLSKIQLDHERVDILVAVVVKVVHECRMMVKEIEDGLVEEMENDGLSKTLMMKEKRLKKMKMVVKYENWVI